MRAAAGGGGVSSDDVDVLAASDRPQRVFDAVREVVAATGAVPGRARRALDSTVFDDAVATQDTVTS